MTRNDKARIKKVLEGQTDAEIAEFRAQLEAVADGTRDPDTNISLLFLVSAEQMRRAREARLRPFDPFDIPF